MAMCGDSCYTCDKLVESLCCTSETNITLYINHTQIKREKNPVITYNQGNFEKKKPCFVIVSIPRDKISSLKKNKSFESNKNINVYVNMKHTLILTDLLNDSTNIKKDY